MSLKWILGQAEAGNRDQLSLHTGGRDANLELSLFPLIRDVSAIVTS